jgi:hypothetical protein
MTAVVSASMLAGAVSAINHGLSLVTTGSSQTSPRLATVTLRFVGLRRVDVVHWHYP